MALHKPKIQSFADYGVEKLDAINVACSPQDVIDIIEFCTSGYPFMSETLTPFQSLAFKLYYGLWPKYGFTKQEQELLDILQNRWGISYDFDNPERFIEILIFVVGRRGTKTTTISLILAYEAYKLIRRGNPQQYYGIRQKHPIKLVQCASSGDQAQDVFEMTKNNLKDCGFFGDYLDYDKDTQTELRIFSPFDIELNKEIIRWNNEFRKPNEPRRQIRRGSIVIECITTSARSHRGGAILCMVFDEFAHFERAKYSGGPAGEAELLSEGSQTDYGMYKAMTPSVTDFGEDGKIICISSPAEKAGKFYALSCAAGTLDQEKPDDFITHPNYLLIQLASWEANPKLTRETLESKRIEDPIGFEMEYGSHFGNPSAAAIDPAVFSELILPSMPIMLKGKSKYRYVICIDPAKGTKDSTYAVGWGHSIPKKSDPTQFEYFVDGLRGFPGEIKYVDGNVFVDIVDPEDVLDWLINTLIRNLGQNNILEICYDQWNSMSAVSRLEAVGLPAVETYFSEDYKEKMYTDFLSELNQNNVWVYELDDTGNADPWVLRAREELRHLQRIVRGKRVLFHAPTTGAVTTDDFADVISNMVYRLKLRDYPTASNLAMLKKSSKRMGVVGGALRPTQLRRHTAPLRGAPVAGGSSGITKGGQGGPSIDRIRRR